jgi:hypothetical protein
MRSVVKEGSIYSIASRSRTPLATRTETADRVTRPGFHTPDSKTCGSAWDICGTNTFSGVQASSFAQVGYDALV